MALNFVRRSGGISEIGKPLVVKRNLSVPVRRPVSGNPGVAGPGSRFRLVITGSGTGTSLSADHLDTGELSRLARSLVSGFSTVHRVAPEGTTDKDTSPAITAWIASNQTTWAIGRNLLVNVLHELRQRGEATPGKAAPYLICIDPPEGIRPDNYGKVSDEQAIRKAIAAAGWCMILPRVPAARPVFAKAATPATPSETPKTAHVFKRARE